MHITVIGAGVSGLLTTLELIEQGCEVTLCDAGDQGQASWAGGGILSPMYPWRYPKAVNALAEHAVPLYQAWNDYIQQKTGSDFEIHQSGMLIFDQADFPIGLRYADLLQQPYQTAELVSGTALKQLNPQLGAGFDQALYFSQLSNIRNPRLLRALWHYLTLNPKFNFRQHCKIVAMQKSGNRIVSLLDQNAEHYQVDQVVWTTGAWSGDWLEQLGIPLSIEPIHGQMLLFKTPENWLPTMCMNQVMYAIPRQDGHIVCGSSMQSQGFDLSLSAQVSQNIQAAVYAMLPALQNFPIIQQWAGFRPGSIDGIPRIGRTPYYENAWVNVGHFRNGLCMGPASARLLRQQMLNQPLLLSDAAYRPSTVNSFY